MDRSNSASGRGAVLVTWAALGVLFAYRVSSAVVDLDLFHQMALVREWLGSGELPRVDLYAFTPTIQPFMHHEWGAGALAYAAATTLGGAGILLLRYALGFGLAAVTVRTALRSGAPPLLVAGMAPVAILLVEGGFPPVRAHAYSFLLAALTLHFCERDRAGDRRWLWALVPLFVVWVNVHAGFVLGLVLVTIYGLERALQRAPVLHVALVLGALIAVVSVNPYGLAYYGHIVRSFGIDRSLVSEWASLWSEDVPLRWQFTFGASAAFVGYALAFGRPAARNGLLIVLATGAFAARHHRLLPFYGAAWLMYCPALLRDSALWAGARRGLEHPRAIIASSGALAVAAGALLWMAHPLTLVVPNEPAPGEAKGSIYYPVGAVAFLRAQNFQGKLLTPFNQGSYVSWKMYPKVKVSLDSRFEAVYEHSLVEELMRVYRTGEGLSEALEKYQPDAILVPRHSGLARASIPWPRIFEDGAFMLYARPGAALNAVRYVPAPLDGFP